MRSKADYYGSFIDLSNVVLRTQFFNLTKEEVSDLCICFYNMVNSAFVDECVIVWENDLNRTIKTEEDIKKALFADKDTHYCEVKGDVKGKRVYNKTTLKRWGHIDPISPIINGIHETVEGISTDYQEYIRNNIKPCLTDTKELRKAIIDLFSEDRHNRGLSTGHDVYGSSMVEPELFSSNYRGELTLRVSCFSLGDAVDSFGNRLCEFVRQISEMNESTNSVIYIGNSEYDSRQVFETLKKHINSNNESLEMYFNWLDSLANSRYLGNVGWFNSISPYTSKLLGNAFDKIQGPFSVEYTHNGSMQIKSDKELRDVKLDDLKVIRKALYPILIPTDEKWPLDWCFREEWETIPVLDEEIETSNSSIRIYHKGYINIDYLVPERELYEKICNIIIKCDPVPEDRSREYDGYGGYYILAQTIICNLNSIKYSKEALKQYIYNSIADIYGKKTARKNINAIEKTANEISIMY